MKINRITRDNPTSGKRCPDCGSHDTIPWPMAGCVGTAGVNGAKTTAICKRWCNGILEGCRKTRR
ncbi:TPA: hypothetical protein ACHTLZ_001611 [Escherichia coli]